jgi:hypothetical protein
MCADVEESDYGGIPLPTLYSGDKDQTKMGKCLDYECRHSFKQYSSREIWLSPVIQATWEARAVEWLEAECPLQESDGL